MWALANRFIQVLKVTRNQYFNIPFNSVKETTGVSVHKKSL